MQRVRPPALLRTARACGLQRWHTASSSVDPRETAKFEADADHWSVAARKAWPACALRTRARRWDTQRGPFAPLHEMNPVRCAFVRDALCRHFGRDAEAPEPLAGLSLLDVGCGGGILCVRCARACARAVALTHCARAEWSRWHAWVRRCWE